MIDTLKAGPLAGQPLELLKAGSSVLSSRAGLMIVSAINPGNPWPFYLRLLEDESDAGRHSAEELSALSFIGERGEDGWITAPELGWSENPVDFRQDVEIEYRGGRVVRCAAGSQDWTWLSDSGTDDSDIIAFRLSAPPAAVEGGDQGRLDVLKVSLAEEIRVAAEQADATPLERFVAEALSSDDAKQNGLVDRVWVVSLPDARKAIAAVSEFSALQASPSVPTEGRDAAVVAELKAALSGLLKLVDALTPDHVAEGVHTGLRKGSDASDAHTLWTAISASDTSAWGDACAFFADSLTDDYCGFGKEISAARSALANPPAIAKGGEA